MAFSKCVSNLSVWFTSLIQFLTEFYGLLEKVSQGSGCRHAFQPRSSPFLLAAGRGAMTSYLRLISTWVPCWHHWVYFLHSVVIQCGSQRPWSCKRSSETFLTSTSSLPNVCRAAMGEGPHGEVSDCGIRLVYYGTLHVLKAAIWPNKEKKNSRSFITSDLAENGHYCICCIEI